MASLLGALTSREIAAFKLGGFYGVPAELALENVALPLAKKGWKRGRKRYRKGGMFTSKKLL
ncbi:hypothetical protein, partial [Nocardia mangyaensis]|uniref:hypothetical protein n=1 Tax=Nocardia mangyaensis TaxID=2213200 RepID=UPI0026749BCC